MHVTAVILMLVAADARSLVQPSPYPEARLRCTYRGILPGSTAESQWVQHATGGGAYVLEVPDADVLLGIVRHDLGERAVRVISWSMDGRDPVGGGILASSRYQLRAEIEAKGGGQGTYLATVHTETVCPGTPREMHPGEGWTCREKVVAGWRWEVGGKPEDSGEEKREREVTYTYVGDESAAVPGVDKVQVAVVESRDGEGGHERMLLDPAVPWCPVKVERLKLGRVVGTDTLVAREIADAPADAAPAPSEGSWDTFFNLLLFGGLGICALVIAIIMLATRRRKRS